MHHYRAPLALLPDGWARDVRLTVDDHGDITEVAGGSATTDRRDSGPVTEARLPGVVVPGIPNLHSHAFQRALAGRTERESQAGDSFWSWRERMYAFLGVLTPDDVAAVAEQLYVELLRHGYTSICEFHYLHLDPAGAAYADPAEMALQVLRAARQAGLGMTLLPVLYRTSDFGGAEPGEGQRRFVLDEDAYLGLVDATVAATAAHADTRAGLAFHSLRAVPPDALARVLEAWRARDLEGPVHIHVAEQQKEVEACLAWSDQRPVAWLLEHASVDATWCLVHATHLDDAEVDGLARSGAVAGLCPTTEANLGDGLFRLGDYLEVGGRWGVGSDSHVSVSPIEELRWLEYGQRLWTRARNVAAGSAERSTGRVLLEGAWQGGTQASGRKLGALAAGHRADWVVLDREHPALAGLDGDQLLDGWVFSGNDTPVSEVWVGGRQVVAEGRHPRQEEVAARYREVVEVLGRRAGR